MDKHADELRRLEEALVEEELKQVHPAFASEEELPQDPPEIRNFANDYGKTSSNKRDNVLLGLVITACILCAGLLAVLIYWLRYLL